MEDDEEMPTNGLLNMGQSFSMGPPDMDHGDGAHDVIPPDYDDEEDGGVASTVWQQEAEMPLAAAPHFALHYSVNQNQLREDAPTDPAELTYEDSALYQEDDEEEDLDPNRPSSTVFRADADDGDDANDGDSHSPGFFQNDDRAFFGGNERGNGARGVPPIRNIRGQASLSVGLGQYEHGDGDGHGDEHNDSYEEEASYEDAGSGHGHGGDTDGDYSFEDDDESESYEGSTDED